MRLSVLAYKVSQSVLIRENRFLNSLAYLLFLHSIA